MIAFICAMQIQNNAFAIRDIINIFLLNKNGCVDARLLFSNVSVQTGSLKAANTFTFFLYWGGICTLI